jgi:hypothetical protein
MTGCSGMRARLSIAALWACRIAIGLASVTQPAGAQQFSAALTITGPGAAPARTARLAVAGRKVRIETSELPGDILIVDAAGTAPAAYLVRPAQRVFMDAKQSSPLTRLFVPLDPADPCRQWRAMAEIAGISDSGQWHCSAAGSETVSGRNTRKFAVTSRRGHSTAWIDANLKFPVRIETEYGAVLTMQDIEQAPQPVQQFEIPGSYRKFDPHGVIELMKRTDIWVAPPDEPDRGIR